MLETMPEDAMRWGVDSFCAWYELYCHSLGKHAVVFKHWLMTCGVPLDRLRDALEAEVLAAAASGSRRTFPPAYVRVVAHRLRRAQELHNRSAMAPCDVCDGSGYVRVIGSVIYRQNNQHPHPTNDTKQIVPWKAVWGGYDPVLYDLLFVCPCGRVRVEQTSPSIATGDMLRGWREWYEPWLSWLSDDEPDVPYRSALRADIVCKGRLLKAAGLTETRQYRECRRAMRSLQRGVRAQPLSQYARKEVVDEQYEQ